jgi:dTDP-4-amino-4,6-dideoxygalactose transaminase
MKIHPRLRLHISFVELASSLCSFFHFSNREQHLQEIKSFWPIDKQVIVTFTVRTSLDLLLQALNLPHGSEVLMSAINIPDMVEIVKRHHLVPVPVDLKLDTLAPDIELLEQLISSKSRIFIVAHLFGSIIDLEPYAKLCQQHQILLVEDCAQAFAGKQYYGSEDADVTFFSFGPIKSCTALGGAIALIQNENLAEKMRFIERQYPIKSELWFLKRAVKYFCLKTLSIPQIYAKLLALMKLLHRDLDLTINSMTRGFAPGDLLPKIRYRPPNRLLALLQRRLKSCDDRWFSDRSQTARKFISLLLPEITCPGARTTSHSFWLVPVIVNNPEMLMTKLRENGFDATRGNSSLAIDNADNQVPPTSLQPLEAQKLMQQILFLPVSPSLPEEELMILGQLVNKSIQIRR